MTRAERVLNGAKKDTQTVLNIMEFHAQEFAEWCGQGGYRYKSLSKLWYDGFTERKTTSELYTIFNKQNK